MLLDIVMPRLSGLEACRILKGMTTEGFLPVVLVTVKTDTREPRRGAQDRRRRLRLQAVRGAGARSRASRRCSASSGCTTTSPRSARKLERLSVHDELTGLYNYRYLHTRLTEEFKRAERYHEPFACASSSTSISCKIAQRRAAARRARRRRHPRGRRGHPPLRARRRRGRALRRRRVSRRPAEHPLRGLGHRGRAHLARDHGAPVRVVDGSKLRTPSRVSIGVALYPSRDVRTKDALAARRRRALSRPSAKAATASASSSSRDTSTRPAIGRDPSTMGRSPASTVPPPSPIAAPSVMPRRGGHDPASTTRSAASRGRPSAYRGRYALRSGSAPARVLVVDDEPQLRRSLARVLMARGFDVLTAEDGRGGLGAPRDRRRST